MSYRPYSYPYCAKCGGRLDNDSELCRCGGVSSYHHRAQEINRGQEQRTLSMAEALEQLEARREPPWHQ